MGAGQYSRAVTSADRKGKKGTRGGVCGTPTGRGAGTHAVISSLELCYEGWCASSPRHLEVVARRAEGAGNSYMQTLLPI